MMEQVVIFSWDRSTGAVNFQVKCPMNEVPMMLLLLRYSADKTEKEYLDRVMPIMGEKK